MNGIHAETDGGSLSFPNQIEQLSSNYNPNSISNRNSIGSTYCSQEDDNLGNSEECNNLIRGSIPAQYDNANYPVDGSNMSSASITSNNQQPQLINLPVCSPYYTSTEYIQIPSVFNNMSLSNSKEYSSNATGVAQSTDNSAAFYPHSDAHLFSRGGNSVGTSAHATNCIGPNSVVNQSGVSHSSCNGLDRRYLYVSFINGLRECDSSWDKQFLNEMLDFHVKELSSSDITLQIVTAYDSIFKNFFNNNGQQSSNYDAHEIRSLLQDLFISRTQYSNYFYTSSTYNLSQRQVGSIKRVAAEMLLSAASKVYVDELPDAERFQIRHCVAQLLDKMADLMKLSPNGSSSSMNSNSNTKNGGSSSSQPVEQLGEMEDMYSNPLKLNSQCITGDLNNANCENAFPKSSYGSYSIDQDSLCASLSCILGKILLHEEGVSDLRNAQKICAGLLTKLGAICPEWKMSAGGSHYYFHWTRIISAENLFGLHPYSTVIFSEILSENWKSRTCEEVCEGLAALSHEKLLTIINDLNAFEMCIMKKNLEQTKSTCLAKNSHIQASTKKRRNTNNAGNADAGSIIEDNDKTKVASETTNKRNRRQAAKGQDSEDFPVNNCVMKRESMSANNDDDIDSNGSNEATQANRSIIPPEWEASSDSGSQNFTGSDANAPRKIDETVLDKMAEILVQSTGAIPGVRFNRICQSWVAYWKYKGQTLSRSFPIAKFGQQAKLNAVKTRKQKEMTGEASVRKPAKSGYRGVYFNRKSSNWVAWWSKQGRTRVKCFGIKEFGFERARELAIDYRKQVEGGIIDPDASDDTAIGPCEVKWPLDANPKSCPPETEGWNQWTFEEFSANPAVPAQEGQCIPNEFSVTPALSAVEEAIATAAQVAAKGLAQPQGGIGEKLTSRGIHNGSWKNTADNNGFARDVARAFCYEDGSRITTEDAPSATKTNGGHFRSSVGQQFNNTKIISESAILPESNDIEWEEINTITPNAKTVNKARRSALPKTRSASDSTNSLAPLSDSEMLQSESFNHLATIGEAGELL